MRHYREAKRDIEASIRARKKEHCRQTIRMNVSDDSNFLSVFSENDTPVISRDVAEFIEESTYSPKPADGLTLCIKSNCIDDDEKILYRKAIRVYYTEKYAAVNRELKKNHLIALALGVIGIFVLAAAIVVGYFYESAIWAEVIDIVAWVFLWEAVDIAFLETRKLKLDRQKYIAYVMMDIEYENIQPAVNR
jgi:hypothetical protein